MEAILVSEVQPTETSQILAANILVSLEKNYPLYASTAYMRALVWWMNGNELSNKLGMSRPSLYYQLLVLGHCVFVMTWKYVRVLFPGRDQDLIAVSTLLGSAPLCEAI